MNKILLTSSWLAFVCSTVSGGAGDLPWSERVTTKRIFADPLVWSGTDAPDEQESEELYHQVAGVEATLKNPSLLKINTTNGQTIATTYRREPTDYAAL